MSGRNLVDVGVRIPKNWVFQSSPAQMSGRNTRFSGLLIDGTKVSILARSDERAQHRPR